MPSPKRLFLADEELGKKDDDHRLKNHPEQRWQPKPWKLVRRRRVFLIPVILYLIYMFFKNMPTDVPPARDRLQSKLPPTHHVMSDTPLPPGLSRSDPPPRAEPDGRDKDDLYYEGKLQFYNLARTLKLFSGHGGKSPSSATVFAGASLGSVSDLLPLACRMANHKKNAVHFVLVGRDDVSIEGIQRVNGLNGETCPLNWHDARVDYARWSTDGRMERAVAAVLPYVQAYLRPRVLITQGEPLEEQFFLRAMRKAQEYGLSHIILPRAARDLMWIAALDSHALQNWNDIHVEFLINAASHSTGSLLRLIKSLDRADFLGFSPGLTIELPSHADHGLLQSLEGMKWLSGTSSKITVRRRIQLHQMSPNEASLRTVEAFYPKKPTFSHVVMLSPNVELAPSFFHYLLYTMLKYKYSAQSTMPYDKLMGISLELQSSPLTNNKPIERPDIENSYYRNNNAPGTLPMFLWQAPNSNAVLYFGDKWAELHSFLSRRLAAKIDAESQVEGDERVISKIYPAFMEHLLELLRARGYYLLYPAFSDKGKFSLATFHNELFQLPEEFDQRSDTDSISEAFRGPAMNEKPLSRASTLMPLLNTFALELPDIKALPKLSYRGEELTDSLDRLASEEYRREFSVRYGGCQGSVGDGTADLFCQA
ncbi:uncharacterized protein DSM5745_10052 [Aspergillus mulundensis]|uniref:Uncharacterized protein n=1 Tax=Aspergillus mulundensis TaxID=1810919 RepID=A0A3D8QMK7_9EURO|nr:Uncharacterized protein DSM5745_10052 [Aspergillus mulundensis]RDW62941.1 Uncharacterized protein DSM5745_10052 [Aspergillus mulundensis]